MPRPHAQRCLRQTITLEEGIAMAVVHETGEPGSTASKAADSPDSPIAPCVRRAGLEPAVSRLRAA